MNSLGLASLIRRARQSLDKPPSHDWIVRPEFDGEFVDEFIIPLELCLPTNRTRGAAKYRHGAVKKALWTQMWMQSGGIRKEPLQGRPQVLAVRFSSVAPDKYSDFAKTAVDYLCTPRKFTVSGALSKRPKKGLNYIKDDGPQFIDLHQWWEPAPKNEGFVYLQVRTGK